MTTLGQFKKTFAWYRHLSVELLNEFPQEHLTRKLSECSIPINCQFIDLGAMQLRIIKMINGYELELERPPDDCADKEKIISYINNANELAMKELESLDPGTAKMDWFGRMQFNFDEALNFMLAHEAMHHGEIISYVYSKNLPTPKIFKETWGLC